MSHRGIFNKTHLPPLHTHSWYIHTVGTYYTQSLAISLHLRNTSSRTYCLGADFMSKCPCLHVTSCPCLHRLPAGGQEGRGRSFLITFHVLSEMLLSREIVCSLMSTGLNELDQPENQPKTASNVSGSESKSGLNNILKTISITSPVATEKSLTCVGGHCSPRLHSHGSAFRAP